ncbi:UDP-N-acetylmuramoyl-tripeptide--D-alanyl-D-alanine ligase [Paenibacillus nicotianae]|uniref:UDP-N-acetylmuramoyl-tripeptide--D-alanyl-D-alanine ligase n=1 Tax=Paenibacillus nicotianae TaxID=1526551 RepID=A0ABW4USU2_9BACL
MNTTLGQIADICGGQLQGSADTRLEGVSINSRQLVQGGLFIPIVGEKFDGHQFVSSALTEGAVASLWQHDHGTPPSGNIVIVQDTLQALQQLAEAYVQQTGVKVVGITGSNGKTTTKDIVYALLAEAYQVHKTEGNFNNHIGLPLTILAMPAQIEILILEMGMSGRGEIELLSTIAHPETTIITNIGESHLQQLGSREEIARAKLEIVSGLRPEGLLIYLGDEPLLKQILAEPAFQQKEMRKITFGLDHTNNVYPTGVMFQGTNTVFTTNSESDEVWTLPLLGMHNVTNALAAITVAQHYEVTAEQIRQGLSKLQLTGMRIEIIQGRHGITLLNDAYNASPTSMKAAIDVLGNLKGYHRKIAVLGDMLELGEEEAIYHQEVGRYIDGQADLLFTYGRLGQQIAEGAAKVLEPSQIRSYLSKQELINDLLEIAQDKDAILFKASRGMKLEEVVQALMPDSTSNAEALEE